MTSKSTPKPVTQPAIPADEAFANVLAAERDGAFMEAQALETQKVAREGRFNQDLARLDAAFKADLHSLEDQIGHQRNKIVAAEAALEKLSGGNVVPLKAAE